MYEIVIYTIQCNDLSIPDTYVGHTKNYDIRKEQHRTLSLTSHRKVYRFIRENGGWSNWTMRIVSYIMCRNKGDASLEELVWYLKMKPKLNTVRPGINYYLRSIGDKVLYEKRKHILDRIEPHITIESLRSSCGREVHKIKTNL